MQIKQTDFNGLYVLEPTVHGDARGWFAETYNAEALRAHGIDIEFVQDNQSYSASARTLRGLHYQLAPYAQTKLIRCTRGKIFDVVVDLRKDEPTFKKWFGIELNADNYLQLLIPQGFAHGFLTLSSDVEVQYKVDAYYAQAADRSLLWNDASIGIEWPLDGEPMLSDKDANAPALAEAEYNF